MKNKNEIIPVAITGNVAPSSNNPRTVNASFRDLLSSGYSLKVDGLAKSDPETLLKRYKPQYEIELFGTRFFLCDPRIADRLKVIPVYVLPAKGMRRGKRIHARVFYKDSSLVWRCATHYVNTPDEHWIGKGAVKWMEKRGEGSYVSAEETTNLPFEMQSSLDDVSRRAPRKPKYDKQILSRILRNAPTDRVWPYQDFDTPREKAMSVIGNRINNNKPVAWFDDDYDPRSLKFAPGYEPDFDAVIDTATSRSVMYHGEIRRYRIASANKRIQYLFVAGTRHVWLIHPQAFTTQLSSYGLRTVDVDADEDLCIPGYEFYDDTDSGEIDDQIPPGFVGPPCPSDPDRADASPWNERLPVIKTFRQVMKQPGPKSVR